MMDGAKHRTTGSVGDLLQARFESMALALESALGSVLLSAKP